ncbi:hypothetical protein [Chitinophaga alhagiae]|uniref:hypothetical protein n=1 Tax=Chitinophaga alhagiae TaxID=2203219 RepID=UPI000E5BA796|nr:hypothetical protein [Chitinophaga alhagiae]
MLVTSSTQQQNNTFLKAYGGTPYMGTVQVDIIRPNGTHVKTDFGDASAHFTSADNGKVKMIVFGAIGNKKGDAGFAVDGVATQKSWKCQSDSIQLSVKENGAIAGSGTVYPQQFTFSGKIADTRLELLTEIKTLKAAENGLPAGTKFTFRYVLRRDIATGTSNTKRRCKKIEWRPQYVGNFDGTGQTVRVPVCVD